MNYQFTDVNPLGSTNYYRLRMVDQDGRFTNSNVIVMRSSNNMKAKIWPNPFRQDVTITYQASTATTVDMIIRDLSGRVLYRDRFAVTAGANQLKSGNLQKLSGGTYIVELKDGTNSSSWKITKQ